jgi:hypothetical protein
VECDYRLKFLFYTYERAKFIKEKQLDVKEISIIKIFNSLFLLVAAQILNDVLVHAPLVGDHIK